MLCNNCGNQINENEKFCTQCGEPVEKKNVCSECKTELTENMKFCWQCGAKVVEENPTPVEDEPIVDEIPEGIIPEPVNEVPQMDTEAVYQPVNQATQTPAEIAFQPVNEVPQMNTEPVYQPENINPGTGSRPGYPPANGIGQMPAHKFNDRSGNNSANQNNMNGQNYNQQFNNGGGFNPANQNNMNNQNYNQQFNNGGGFNPNYQGNNSMNYNQGFPGPGLQAPKKYQMISKYKGEPTVGIAEASGSVTVYQDHFEFSKTFGSAAGNAFGLIGMAVASKKAKDNGGKVEYYYYQDIQNAYVGKYGGLMPAVVLVMNDGRTVSFNGTFTKQSATDIVNTINAFKANM